MTYLEALETEVTATEACAECERHGFYADFDDSEVFDCATGETIALANSDGLYNGGDILAWLGY